MTKIIEISQAEGHLQELLASVNPGDEIILAVNQQPVGRLTPIAQPQGERIGGLERGKIWISEDFDEPMPEEFWTGTE